MAALAVITMAMSGTAMGGVSYASKPNPGHKVTLCHRTNSNTNPYVQITVDVASVFKQGHDGHSGPVWNPSLKAQHTKWGDIIPSFDYTNKKDVTLHYSGKNLSTEGVAILSAGCTVTQENPSPSPSPTPTETSPAPTPTPTEPTPSDTPTTHKPRVVPPVHVTKAPKTPVAPNAPTAPVVKHHQKPLTALPFTGPKHMGLLGILAGSVMLLGSALVAVGRRRKNVLN